MKWLALSVLICGFFGSAARADEAPPVKGKLTAETLDQYIGAYVSNANDHQNKFYAYFLKDDVVLKSNSRHLVHYVLLRSNNPLVSEPAAVADAEAVRDAADFYLTEDGKFYQSWRDAGVYAAPGELTDIDQVKPGERCGWRPVTAQQAATIDMNYCGNGDPRDRITFGGGGEVLKIQYIRYNLNGGHYGWVADEIFVRK